MATALALLVAAGFVWSLILFTAAVIMHERKQEAGFRWALAGAVIYLVTFSDHLPGSPTGLRTLFQVLPGVSHADSRFASSTAVIAVLAVAYVLRVLIFYQLFLDLPELDLDGNGRADSVNDLVAPVLSYVCFSICIVTALQGLYELSVIPTIGLAGAAFALYYVPTIARMLVPYLDVVYESARSAVILVGQRISDAVVQLIIAIGRAEIARRGGNTTKLDARAEQQRIDSARRVANARARRAEAIDKLGKEAEEPGRPARGSESNRPPTPPNPNYR